VITVVIKDKFDLGYILELEDGREGQLRATEMKGDCLQIHVEGREKELFGQRIEVYIILDIGNQVLFSQFSEEERAQRDREFELKRAAVKSCKLKEEFDAEIIKAFDWGYVFKQVSGYLESAITNENVPKETCLTIGKLVKVKVIGFNERAYPIFTINTEQENA